MARPKKTDSIKKETIITAATALFADLGFHGASMREIAKVTGVNMATISYHFGNKEGLYHSVFKDLAEKERLQYEHFINNLPEESFKDPEIFRATCIRLLDLYIDYSTSSPVTFHLWRQYIMNIPQDERVTKAEYDLPIFQMIIRLLEKAKMNSIISPRTENIGIIVSVLTSVVSRFCEKRFIDKLSGEDFYGVENIDELRNFLVLYLDLMLCYQNKDS